MDYPIRLLVTGDLHLGRYPSRVPSDLNELEVAFVWDRIVTEAINRQVDALVLTGDIANAENQFFEAYGPLTTQLTRLADAGIPAFAVAGNHDFEVLPKLAERLGPDKFRLLGQGSRWESAPLVKDGTTVMHFLGWSFSSQYLTKSALEQHPEVPGGGVPVLGVLHADLDQKDSRYNPVSQSELARVPVSSWLLGHIHAASVHTISNGIILYPGSPQPLDPGEKGIHGPWLLEVAQDGTTSAEQMALSTLSYLSAEIDLSDAEKDTTLEVFLHSRIVETLEQHIRTVPNLRHIALRLRLFGLTGWYEPLLGVVSELAEQWNESIDGVDVTIEKIENDTRPMLDLENLARGDDPPGVLAGILLRQENGRTEAADQELVEVIRRRVEQIKRVRAFNILPREDPATEPTSESEYIKRVGWQLLDALVNQKTTGQDHE